MLGCTGSLQFLFLFSSDEVSEWLDDVCVVNEMSTWIVNYRLLKVCNAEGKCMELALQVNHGGTRLAIDNWEGGLLG
jgi:uncharacterized protein YerC